MGFTANIDKCEFERESLVFYGVNFSAKGMSPAKERVEDFQKTTPPTNVSEVKFYTQSDLLKYSEFLIFIPSK